MFFISDGTTAIRAGIDATVSFDITAASIDVKLADTAQLLLFDAENNTVFDGSVRIPFSYVYAD